MVTSRRIIGSLIAILFAVFLVGCNAPKQQARVDDAIRAVPVQSKTNYFERKQISQIEDVTDQLGKIYYVYHVTMNGDVFDQVMCKGRPTSSTESLEPNELYGRWESSYGQYGFQVPLEGDQVGYSPEAMGRDGTYGEPVAFRQCITTENRYHDFPNQAGLTPLVYDYPRNFDNPRQAFSAELAAKQLIAEQAIAQGKCVDWDLNVITCSQEIIERQEQVPAPSAAPSYDPMNSPSVPGGEDEIQPSQPAIQP